MFFECMRKEVVIGGGDIKEGECILGRRGLFIGWREVRRADEHDEHDDEDDDDYDDEDDDNDDDDD